ncbi:hypothetical protein N5K21_28520 [Rhizobium pusense]|uniref:helix-turn-helix domain-containing protein n=1 Tax=Agrobacterium pusense TaxID=648995 RepID=UPI002448D79E|nr:helix-turn-helix domain-containing protein [Agrobacterium pusense]MDH2092647.1 hypothetical protein [Agrobacterium pusense]
MNHHVTLTPSQRAWHEAAKAREAERVRKARKLQEQHESNFPNVVYIDAMPKPKSVKRPLYKHLSHKIEPEWKGREILFDAHVKQWRYLSGQENITCRAYIKIRAAEFGMTFEDIIGPKRSRKYVEPRHLIMWEVKTKLRPEMSYPELGRLFGGRDHSSALFAVRKIDAQKA